MDAERLPVGAYVASALVAANYGGDSGEDVDRFLNHLEARGYAVVPLDAERKADASCPACGGEAGHDWWSVGDDSYACDRAALPIYALVSEMETEGWDQATLAEIAARCTRGLRFAAPAVTETDLLDVKWWATKLGERNGSNRDKAEFVVATLASRLAPAVTECNVEGFHDHRFDGPHRLARQTRCIREEASDG